MARWQRGLLGAGALAASACSTLLGAEFEDAKLDGTGTPSSSEASTSAASSSASESGAGATGGVAGGGGAPSGAGADGGSTTASTGGAGSGGGGGGTHLWSKRFGHGVDQQLEHMTVDADGNVLLVGRFRSSIDFGGPALSSVGDWDLFVAKLDPDGDHVWSRAYGSPKDDKATAVATAANGDVYVTGSINGPTSFGGDVLDPHGQYDLYILRLDAKGNHLASERYGEPKAAQTAYGIAVSPKAEVIITGRCEDRLDLGPGVSRDCDDPGDAFVAALDPGWSPQWSQVYEGSGAQLGDRLVLGATGDIYFTGVSYEAIDLGGGPIPSAPQNNVAFLAKLDHAGVHSWSKSLGQTNSFGVGSVAVAPNGDVLAVTSLDGSIDLGGGFVPSSAGALDVLVVRYAADGALIWGKAFGSVSHDQVPDVAVGPNGEIFVSARHGGPLAGLPQVPYAGSSDVFLVRLDDAGNPIWARGFGDAVAQYAHGLAASPDGTVILGATCKGTVDWGGGPLTAVGDADVMVAKFLP